MAVASRRAPISLLAALALGVSLSAPSFAQQYTVIHSLAITEGNSPRSPLNQDVGGKLYGTAVFNGEHSSGSVFKLDTNGDNFAVIHAFDGSDGNKPYAGLVLGGGFLFGVTANGGTGGAGVVYKVDTNGSNFAVIHHLDGANDGSSPFGTLVQGPDTILYGVAHDGGANGFGTVFSIDPGGSTYTVLHTFGSTATDGSNPYGGLLLASDGKLYGTTEKGHNGTGLGTVFRLDTDGDNFETLHTFTAGNDGQDPLAPLKETPDGFLYGTTLNGGSSSQGTVFKLRRDGTGYLIVHAFSGDEGTDSHSSLIQITGGLMYGTAASGGSGSGTVFRMTMAGQLAASAHDFTTASGATPHGAVLQGIDGALYGTASTGGAHSVGAIFRLTTPPVLSILPDSGPAGGGIDVTISGSGFANQATVALSGSFATGVGVDNSTTIEATTPSLAPGALHDLAVTNTDGSMGFLQAAWLADFLDVPQIDSFHDYVEAIVRAGITAGCGGGNYCRNFPVTRAQMAVFLLKAKHGAHYLPPPCTSAFADVACPSTFADWIEQLVEEGISVGCGGNNYCPNNPVRRDQMAVFLLKASHPPGYAPPGCHGVFTDVTCPSTFADWIEQLVAQQITVGCGGTHYCPSFANTRGQMAVFLTKTFLTPAVITVGGIYSGVWQSLDPAAPAVRIETPELVVLENCTLSSKTNLVEVGVGGHVIIRNCTGHGLDPGVAGQQRGDFVFAYKIASLVFEHNTMDGVRTATELLADDDWKPDGPIRVRFNRATNLDGAPSDGMGGRDLSHLRFIEDNGNPFVQLSRFHALVVDTEIAYNEVINEPAVSSVGDVINIYSSSGAPGHPILIHDNYIYGGYPAHPGATLYYSNGITMDGTATDTPATATAFVKIFNNQIVNHAHMGIALVAGHDNEAFGNRTVTTGRSRTGEWTGAGWGVGVNVSNCPCYNQPPDVYFGNFAHDNLSGWVYELEDPNHPGERIPPPLRLDYFLPDCDGGEEGPESRCTANELLPDPITKDTEDAETALWEQKKAAAGIYVGAIPAGQGSAPRVVSDPGHPPSVPKRSWSQPGRR